MPRLSPLLLLVLTFAACGGGDDRQAQTTPTPSPSPRATPSAEPEGGGGGGSEEQRPPTGPVTSAEEAVIRGWSDALRRGDVDRAVGYWALPAIASNGGQPFRLVSKRAVRFFNEALPCGAKLEATRRDANYILATFRLTERPGPGDCGQGVGEQVRTLFLLRDGKIVQWLRASDPRPPSEAPGGSTT